MANPATTTRSTPGGIPLRDGYSTKIAFAMDPDISFWEKTVKPPMIDTGDPIDITTMHNTSWITKIPQSLADSGNIEVTASYDPACYDQIETIKGRNGSITVRFSDGSQLDVWGYLRSFDPQEVSRGAQPEANIVIVVTNWDENNDVEAGPNLTSVAGT